LARLSEVGRPLVVMVDEASLAARDPSRHEGRRALWREIAPDGNVVFVDLAQPDLDRIEAEFVKLA
jgi:hypothetical protein